MTRQAMHRSRKRPPEEKSEPDGSVFLGWNPGQRFNVLCPGRIRACNTLCNPLRDGWPREQLVIHTADH